MRNFVLTALAIVVLGVVLTTAAVGAFSIDSSTSRVVLAQESISADRGVDLLLQGNSIATRDRNSNGESCPGREASAGNPIIRNDWTLDNLMYMALIREERPNSWGQNRVYRVEVFGDGSLITTLYFKNETAEAVVEGVKLRVDVGLPDDAPSSYSTIVTRLNGCP